jgi:site-specific recombinase XerD
MNASSTSIHELAAAFAEHLLRVRLRAPRTVDNYRRVAELLIAHVGSGDAAIVSDTKVLRGFLAARRIDDVGMARASWNAKRSALRSFYAFLLAEGLRSDDPTSALERQRVPYREATVLSLREMVALVEAVKRGSTTVYRSRNVALVQVMIHTALRLSEVCSLSLDQTDVHAHVFRAVKRKGSKVFDSVFNDVVAEALEHLVADRPRLVRDSGVRALFLSDRGLPLAKRTLQEMVSRYARLAGIARPISPHALRHGSATALANLGTPIRTIQEICGHSSVATTERYIHVASRDRHEAVEKLGRAFCAERSAASPPAA